MQTVGDMLVDKFGKPTTEAMTGVLRAVEHLAPHEQLNALAVAYAFVCLTYKQSIEKTMQVAGTAYQWHQAAYENSEEVAEN